jgi:hypothetical protein
MSGRPDVWPRGTTLPKCACSGRQPVGVAPPQTASSPTSQAVAAGPDGLSKWPPRGSLGRMVAARYGAGKGYPRWRWVQVWHHKRCVDAARSSAFSTTAMQPSGLCTCRIQASPHTRLNSSAHFTFPCRWHVCVGMAALAACGLGNHQLPVACATRKDTEVFPRGMSRCRDEAAKPRPEAAVRAPARCCLCSLASSSGRSTIHPVAACGVPAPVVHAANTGTVFPSSLGLFRPQVKMHTRSRHSRWRMFRCAGVPPRPRQQWKRCGPPRGLAEGESPALGSKASHPH